MAISESFSCLGIEALGLCSYDPSHPTIYLTIGNAISALGFTVAIQQLIKPLYKYRLNAYGINFTHLSGGIFVGFLFTIFAALLPNLPLPRDYIFSYPIFWEISAAIIIGSVYALASYLIIRPVKIANWNVFKYINAAANFLSEANDEERAKFAIDLTHNAKDLFKFASYWDKAEGAFYSIEFDRLRAAGKDLSITGRPPVCAFYMYAHKKELQQSSQVRSFLLIIADPKFCSVLVKDCPWHTAHLLRHIRKEELYTRAAENFIQEIGLQAVGNDDSMMSREIGYEGFAHAPLLAESLFSDWAMLRNYRPLSKVGFNLPKSLTEKHIKKLNLASELMMECVLANQDYWGCQYFYDVERAYEAVCERLEWDKKPEDRDIGIDVSLNFGIDKIYTMLIEHFDTMKLDRYKSLFVTKNQRRHGQIVEIVSDIIFKSYLSMPNDFDVNGKGWSTAIGHFMDLFSFHADEPEGFNPLQQHLAIKFAEKLDRNMEGWYPSLSRVLLAVIGPYESHPKITTKTAHALLKDIVYKRLQKLPDLYAKKPEKFKDFLPSNVEYDPATNSLTHTYSGGSQAVTKLNNLLLPDIDPYDQTNWMLPQRKIINLLKKI